VRTQSILFGTVGLMVAAIAIGCGNGNNTTADRSADNTPAATQPVAPPSDWTTDRDAYIARRQQDLDELQQRWDTAKAKADRTARQAWRETEKETATLRHDLAEAKDTSREKWEATRQKLDESWNRIQNKAHHALHDENRGS